MNKEILEWINNQKKSKTDLLLTMKKSTRTGICKIYNDPDPIKEDLKILKQIKKELEEKDKLEQKQMLNSREEEPMEVPVLDDVEKRYLKNVIRPFKDQCRYVKKYETAGTDYEWIYINLSSNGSIALPGFSKGTMYKNMELEKRYTLEELGITYEEKK